MKKTKLVSGVAAAIGLGWALAATAAAPDPCNRAKTGWEE